MDAQAWPGAAAGSKWLLEPAPGPQMARNGRSSLARSRRWLEMAARACLGAADGSKWPLELAPEPQNTRRVPLENWDDSFGDSQSPTEYSNKVAYTCNVYATGMIAVANPTPDSLGMIFLKFYVIEKWKLD